MKNEHLDELIDRVAAELTAVSADPGFTGRLRARLHPRRARLSVSLLVVASAAAVLVAAVAMTLPGRLGESRQDNRPVASGAAPPVVTSSPNALLAEPTPRPATRESDGNVRVRPRDIDVLEPPPLAMADSEATAIAPLAIEPLALPTVPELDPLDVPALEIAEIGASSDAKEPR